jgi:hypothetical protein
MRALTSRFPSIVVIVFALASTLPAQEQKPADGAGRGEPTEAQ